MLRRRLRSPRLEAPYGHRGGGPGTRSRKPLVVAALLLALAAPAPSALAAFRGPPATGATPAGAPLVLISGGRTFDWTALAAVARWGAPASSHNLGGAARKHRGRALRRHNHRSAGGRAHRRTPAARRGHGHSLTSHRRGHARHLGARHHPARGRHLGRARKLGQRGHLRRVRHPSGRRRVLKRHPHHRKRTLATLVRGSAPVAVPAATATLQQSPVEPPPPPNEMAVGVDAGGWGPSAFSDIAGAVKTVRLNANFATDSEVGGAAAAGVRVGSWLFGTGGTIGSINPAAMAAEIVAVFKRYGKGGTFWAGKTDLGSTAVELLNEPGNPYFWSDATNYAAYAALSRVVHAALEASFAPANRPKLLLSYDGGFAGSEYGRAIFAAGAVADGVTVHPYGGKSNPAGSAEGHRERAVQAHSETGLPVYVTEIGWPTASGQPPTGDSLQWTEQQQAENIKKFITWADETKYVAMVVIFNYVDYGSNDWYGIERKDRSHKLSYSALAEASTHAAPVLPAAETPVVTPPSTTVTAPSTAGTPAAGPSGAQPATGPPPVAPPLTAVMELGRGAPGGVLLEEGPASESQPSSAGPASPGTGQNAVRGSRPVGVPHRRSHRHRAAARHLRVKRWNLWMG
jgi:hypothetical protein